MNDTDLNRMLSRTLVAAVLAAALIGGAASARAATYYISPAGDDGTGDGSEGNPWKTPGTVEDRLANGDTVVMLPGDYGIDFDLKRTGYTRAGWDDGNVWRATDPSDPETWPTFTKIAIDANGDAYISVKGISVVCSEGTGASGDAACVISDVKHVLVEDAYVEGYQKKHPECTATQATDYGVIWRKWENGQTFGDITFRRLDLGYIRWCLLPQYVTGSMSGDVLFEDCKITKWTIGAQLTGDNGHWVRLHDCEFYDAAYGYSDHGNVMRVIGDYAEVLRCHVHAGKSSRMLIGSQYGDEYAAGVAHFTMRDCVIYAAKGTHPTVSFTVFDGQGGGVRNDIIITGNTVVPIRPGNYASVTDDNRYVLALRLIVKPGASGKNIVVANNILAGKVVLDTANMDGEVITGNLLWAYDNGAGLQRTAAGNVVLCYGEGQFNAPCDAANWMEVAGNLWAGGDDWAQHAPIIGDASFNRLADMTDEYLLADNTSNPAWDLGDGARGTPTDFAGVSRHPATPDAGAFEFAAQPGVTCWRSRGDHGTAGSMWMALPDGGVEPRTGGIRALRISVNCALDPGTVTAAAVGVTGQTGGDLASRVEAAAWDAGSRSILVTFDAPLAEVDRYTIALAETVGPPGGGALADRSATFGVLAGDVDGSGQVTAADVLGVRGAAGQTLGDANAGFDVNCSGDITGDDLQAVQKRVGTRLPQQ